MILHIFFMFSGCCVFLPMSFSLFLAGRFYSDFFEMRTCCDLSTQAKTLASFVTLNESLGTTPYWLKKYILDKKICISFLTGVQFSPSFVKMFAVLEYAMDLCSWPCLDKADLSEYLPLSHTLLEIWLIGLTSCHQ